MPTIMEPLSSPSVTFASTWFGFLLGSRVWVPAWTTLPSSVTDHLSPVKVICSLAKSSFGFALPSISCEMNFQVPCIFFSSFSLCPPPQRAPPAASITKAANVRVIARMGVPPKGCRSRYFFQRLLEICQSQEHIRRQPIDFFVELHDFQLRFLIHFIFDVGADAILFHLAILAEQHEHRQDDRLQGNDHCQKSIGVRIERMQP